MARSWLTIGFALLVAGGLLSYQLYDDHSDLTVQEQQRLVSLASAININMSEQLRASSRMLDLLAHVAPTLLAEPEGVARLNARMGLVSESVIGIRSLLLVDASGNVTASNRPELVGQNFQGSDRYKAIRESIDPKMLFISAPFTTPLGNYTISLGKVLLTPKGEFNGYLLAILTPEYFSVLMKSLLYAQDMRLSVAHVDGKVIYSTQSVPDIRGIDLSSTPNSLFNRHKASGQETSFTIDRATATNDLRFIALHTVLPAAIDADKALLVAVSRDATAVYSNWRASAIQAGGLYFGFVIAVCLGFFAYSRRQTAYQELAREKEDERKLFESVAKNERFIRAITDAMPGLVAYFDRDLCCRFANKAYLDWYQMPWEQMAGTTLMALLGDSLFAKNQPYIDAVLAGQHQHFERFLTKRDGSVGHVLANYIPDSDESGVITGFILLVTDIKALRLAEADLKVAGTVFENTVDGIMVTDSHGVILSVNPAFTEITGYPAQEAVGQTPRLFRSNHHDEAFHATVWQQIAERGEWKGEIWNRRKNGEIFVMWQAITRVGDNDEQLGRYISVFHDVTESWQRNEQNRHLAFHDALTGLPNRALLMERLERQVVMSERQPQCLAVLFLDLDGFKLVNDTLGHAVGDELLKVLANKLQALVRQTDTVARLGGDEFVVLLDNPANLEEVLNIANRIIAAVNEPVELNGVVARVGTSIGVAIYPEHGNSSAALLKGADEAMYQAKQAGKNTYRLAESISAEI